MPVYEDERAKLHPNGHAVYGADNYTIPSDLDKWGIENGNANYLYRFPHHNEYEVCSDLWISEDGLKIFTKCGNVFRSSDDENEDMLYENNLNGLSRIESLAHSSAADKVIAIPSNWMPQKYLDTQIQLYNYSPLTLERTIPLPKFQLNQNEYISHGRFVFINSPGRTYYVVVQADESAGLYHDFGVVSDDIE